MTNLILKSIKTETDIEELEVIQMSSFANHQKKVEDFIACCVKRCLYQTHRKVTSDNGKLDYPIRDVALHAFGIPPYLKATANCHR